jgi:hypothetical protein
MSVPAPAPNNSNMPGAGTSVPLLEPWLEEPWLDEPQLEDPWLEEP